MYQLFKDDTIIRNTKIDAPDFLFVRRMLLKEITRIRNYYRESNYVVSGTHLLNQLLINLNVSMSRDLESYTRVCGIETERLARAFRLIHPVVDNPTPIQGQFYNKGCNEFIIIHSNPFDYNSAYNNWKNLTPVRVHYHDFSDLNCGIPDGNYTNSIRESGVAVISINLPLLAVQYRAWQDKVNQHREVKSQTVNFLYQYPVCNMIYQHMELVLFNRMTKLYRQLPTPSYKNPHPIAIADMSERVDRCLLSRVDIIKKGNFRFEQLFSVFDCLTRKTFFDVVKPLDLAPVRSVKWVLELQVLGLFEFFLEVRRDTNGSYNGYEISKSLRDIKHLENDATYFKANYMELNRRLNNMRILAST